MGTLRKFVKDESKKQSKKNPQLSNNNLNGMDMSGNINNGMSPIGDESDIEGEASLQGGDTTGNSFITSKNLSINGFGMISN